MFIVCSFNLSFDEKILILIFFVSKTLVEVEFYFIHFYSL